MKSRLLLFVVFLLAILMLPNALTHQAASFSSNVTVQTTSGNDSCYTISSELEVESIEDVEWSPDGTLLAVVSGNDILLFPEGDLSQEPRSLQGHTDQVVDIDFSIDGIYLASAGWDGALIIWNLATNEIEQELPKREGMNEGSPIPYLSVQFSPDGRFLAAGTLEEDRAAYLWEVGSWVRKGLYLDHYTGVYGVAFNDDTSILATISGPELRLYDIETGEILHQIIYDGIAVYSLQFSENLLLFSAIADSQQEDNLAGIYSWNIESDEQAQLIYPSSYGAWVSVTDTYPNNSDIIAFTSAENGVVIFHLTLMTPIGTFGASEYPILDLNFNPNGQNLVVSSQDGMVRIWSMCQ